MPKNIKSSLTFSKNRVVLSDVLPYEVPPIFSNRLFYRFLNKYKIEYFPPEKDNDFGIIRWKNCFDDDSERIFFKKIIKLLFSSNKMNDDNDFECNGCLYSFKVRPKNFTKIPFSFDIAHKDHELRTLSIPHIFNQLQMINFYNSFKDLIIYYTSKSSYSIRRPKSIAKSYYFKDRTHSKNISRDLNFTIEEYEKEYETLKSFFTYDKYSNVYKFFESYVYHRAEKKYNNLLKLDISKCFDSVYTHSISWAILDKYEVKKCINESKSFFAGKFDVLMQNLNFSETNGVIIGPEFSRVFVELILQKIDFRLSEKLDEKLIKKGVDYEIYRYVDDYFVFYNDDAHKNKIIKFLQLELKEYKLSLNNEKFIIYNKPIITEITVAKNLISDFINKIVFKVEDLVDAGTGEKKKNGSLFIDATKLIVDFKTILKSSGAGYKDVLNYTLSSLETKLDELLNIYLSIDNKSERHFISALIELVEFVFFIYSSSQRVGYTIKVSRILQNIITFSNKNFKNKDLKHHLFKSISDNINIIFRNNKFDDHIHVETLYLLITIAELGRTYKITEKNLADYFGFVEDCDSKFGINKNLGYFAIVCILFYIKNFDEYSKIKKSIEITIVEKYKSVDDDYRSMSAELTLLLFDTLSCPFISVPTKKCLLACYKVQSRQVKLDIISFCMSEGWFVKWAGFNLKKELESKRSMEVY